METLFETLIDPPIEHLRDGMARRNLGGVGWGFGRILPDKKGLLWVPE